MSRFVKNPFGKRKGQLITIGDLTPDERGAKCNCICPYCEGKFLAKIGSVRSPHFAHEKDSMCDPEKAFMESLYMFLCDAISDTDSFTYPGLYGFFPGFDISRKATRADIESNVSYSDTAPPPEADYDEIIVKKVVSVSNTEIQRNSKGLPQVLLAKHIDARGAEHVLAIQIVLPPNICKTFAPKQYKEYPTLAIQITDDLYHIKSDALKIRLRDDDDAKTWIHSPLIEKWLKKQLQKQHEAHQRYIDERHKSNQRNMELYKQRKQAIESERKKVGALEQERAQAWNDCKRKVEQCGKNAEIQVSELSGNEKIYSQWLSIEYPIPPTDKQVRDWNGTRWARCDKCNIWFPDSEMSYLGGPGEKLNRGACRWCVRNRTQQK